MNSFIDEHRLTLRGREASIDAWPAIDRSNSKTNRNRTTLITYLISSSRQLRMMMREAVADAQMHLARMADEA